MSKQLRPENADLRDVSHETHDTHGPLGLLTLGALGVVFGDIGTSPLYAIKESFHHTATHAIEVNSANVLGLLSLILYSLILVICVKYLLVIMKADNHGEGGILALTSLISGEDSKQGLGRFMVLAGLFGAALLYGDGMITPAISVLAAIEGTTEVTDSLKPWVAPIAIGILVALFLVQRRGTASMGKAFGPIMALWFSVLAVLGVTNIIGEPSVLKALNPLYAVQFFLDNGAQGFFVLGSVFLVVTGGEALYADMGHFGRKPIVLAWYCLAFPSLLLAYFGQGALLLAHPEYAHSPFFNMAPRWALVPLVMLATAATVIASQALISGAFSMTKQAVQLGYLPRVRILQTSDQAEGQIYVPVVNWVLLLGCIGLVLGFKTTTNLAAAYGLAVTGTMAITTILFYRVATTRLGWSRTRAGIVCGVFLLADAGFLGANIPKIPAGGWFPLIVGLLLLLVLTTWFAGRKLMAERIAATDISIEEFGSRLATSGIMRGPGVGVYLGSNAVAAPKSLVSQLQHSGVLPENICVLTVANERIPHISPNERLKCTEGPGGIKRIVCHYGFTDEIDVPSLLEEFGMERTGISFEQATYVIGRETLRATDRAGMALWRERFFILMVRNANPVDLYFKLPPTRTVEIGVQIEL